MKRQTTTVAPGEDLGWEFGKMLRIFGDSFQPFRFEAGEMDDLK